ncbi:MAG: hypothetical protein WD342_02775 [Verrucomicrobiales bacterium]
MKIYFQFIWLVAALLVAGCVPNERFWWSPDGSRAAVVIDHRLHLADETGAIVESLPVEGSTHKSALVEGVDWLPDGDGFVTSRIRAFSQWADARPLLSDEEAGRIEALSQGMPGLLEAAVLLGGDAENPAALLERVSSDETAAARNAFLLALERQPELVRESLKDAPKARAGLEDAGAYLVHELALIRLAGTETSPRTEILLSSIEAVASPRVSPRFPVVAYGRREASGPLVAVKLLSLEGKEPAAALEEVHESFGWSADGRSLVFMVPLAKDTGLLKHLRKTTVLDGSGNRIGRKERETDNLATTVVPFAPRLDVLPDGRILFASQTGSIPVSAAETPHEAHLYTVAATGGVAVRIPTAPGALPMDLGHFVASPDGRLAAVVESETDAVAVVDLESGETEIISPSHPGWQCRTLPNWKSAKELSFAALNDSTGEIEWKLWTRRGGTKPLGKDWPEGATDGWLAKKDPKESAGVPPSTN